VDTDGDGLPDLWEMSNGLNPALAGDAALDLDGDGLSNAAEFAAKTSPTLADTSGDGINDRLAISLGLDPLLSYPAIRATLSELQGSGTPTAGQVRALYPNIPIISRNAQTGKFDLRVGIQESGNLTHWQKLPIQAAETRLENGDLIFSFGGGAGAHFYRVSSGE
jgi:hypothetical protein